jgi:hypothetical protein
MHIIDIAILIIYMLAMLGIGYYFMKRNKTTEDYFVSGRNKILSNWQSSVDDKRKTATHDYILVVTDADF